ncbi:MAG: DMT family transporter [Planctomycetales bacterium]|nr:DMT family transporter [Planctomycetales bacterium]
MRDYLKLHFVVVLWGFTAVLGKLIDLSATQVVLFRACASAAILFMVFPRRALIPKRLIVALIANGMLLGFHWMMFFLAVKIANVSICMIAMATISFWTALIEPILVRKVRFQWINLLLGLIVVDAVYWIYHSETQFHYGLVVALIGAILATLFSIANGLFAGKVDEQSIVMYEMAGAALFCFLALGVANLFGYQLGSDRWIPIQWEWLWLGILVFGGTLLAYYLYVELLRRLSVFTINFANNLEPVYGISLGALFFGDHHLLGSGFYAGTAVILVAVFVQPWLVKSESSPSGD